MAPHDLIELLIVDDDPAMLEELRQRMSQEFRYNILTAKTGSEALEMIREHVGIKAVLSDIAMPGMSGLELLEQVRKLGSDIPFIFFTGHTDRELMHRALYLGASEFIGKPCDPRELVWVVRQSLRLGVLLTTLATEFGNLCRKYEISAPEMERFGQIQKQIWAVKNERRG